MTPLRVQYLNHASLLVSMGEARILFDPWFQGTAFSGGWGLRYDNPQAEEEAARATHLWISHWHSDHLHAPTLQALAKRNPDIVVLANVSANFSMVGRLKAFGFHEVREVGEREVFELADGVEACRYPTAGIDNMLHIRSKDWSLLNYNDCNLPAGAIKSLRKRIGKVDLLFTNYNHAGKLFDREGDDQRKTQLLETLVQTVNVIDPTRVIPFASSHYYRTEESADQNHSLLDFDEVEAHTQSDERFVVLRIGDEATFGSPSVSKTRPLTPALRPSVSEVHDYGESVPWEELLEEVSTRCVALQAQFLRMGKLAVPDLIVRVPDHGRNIRLSIGSQAKEAPTTETPHIEAHSQALRIWLARRFGDDTFIAGAHFRVLREDTSAIERWALVTLLEASHLDPQRCLGYLVKGEGRRFLWNRREEIMSTLLGRRVKAGRMRI